MKPKKIDLSKSLEDQFESNQNIPDTLIEIGKFTFHAIDSDNDIEIEVDGWSYFMSIEQTQKLVKFLNNQI